MEAKERLSPVACEAPKQQVHQCTHICQKVGPSTAMPMTVRSNSAYKLIRQPSFFPLQVKRIAFI